MWSPARVLVGRAAGRMSSFLIYTITQILLDGFWKKCKWLYIPGLGRSLSFWRFLPRVICPWPPLQILGKILFFAMTSSNQWISMKLFSCNVVRAWPLPFGFGPDICSYLPLPLAKFHRFCNFHDNLSSNEQIPMKLYIYKALSAWMLSLRFRADICSYLPLSGGRADVIISYLHDNSNSTGRILKKKKLAVHSGPWTLPLVLEIPTESCLPLAAITDSGNKLHFSR